MVFEPPIAAIRFAMDAAAGLGPAAAHGAFSDLGEDVVAAVLEEAARFAANEIAPLNRIGDTVGARRNDDGSVTTPPGWREAYRRFCDSGWNGLSAPAAHGGQGLPTTLAMAAQEMWNGGSAAFALAPMLTAGAIEALDAHGSEGLKARYLPRMVSGEWTGTMNLTEPQAGSDLGAIRTRAEPAGDGAYRLFGEKIFITYGEHDLATNIIHLVLARITGVPEGTKGISLFVVPKRLVNDDGSLGEANDVACARIEEKLGIHGSPTCAMIYGGSGRGATGFLVGEANRGLAGMFTMMNLARLNVGIQGVGVAERAYQEALAFARERRQGRAPGIQGAAPIVAHPDVQAMLLRMQALIGASRALCYSCAFAFDMSRHAPEAERAAWADRASLLTPLAKAFSTDAANEVTSLAVQVHGGMGYVEETGAAQHLRDARIFAIYEGTNGIQALDLATRRLKLAGGAAVAAFIDELAGIAAAARASSRPDLAAAGARLEPAVQSLRRATHFMTTAEVVGRGEDALIGATPSVYSNSAAETVVVNERTNYEAAFGPPDVDVAVTLIRARLSHSIRAPMHHFEPALALHYETGQRFLPHYDFLDPKLPSHQPDLMRRGQRVATALLYLNDDFEGGQTDFPRLGWRFRGDVGDLLVFDNIDSTGACDPRTFHAGLPPTRGEKWILSQWVRDRPQS